MRESRLRWASIISGGGTTMDAMAQACLPGGALYGLVEPVGVIATNDKAEGIQKAKALDIPVTIIPRKEFPKGSHGVDLYGKSVKNILLYQYHLDIVTLNGCLTLMSPEVIEQFPMYNQHPGDPVYVGGEGMYGRRVHAAALLTTRILKREHPWTTMVAQRVDPVYDRGAVVKEQHVEIFRADTVESLQQRALPIEHQVQIALLYDVATENMREIAGREPFINPVNPYEHVVLYCAKKAAIALYPNG